jgi:hypothetical protein
VAGATYRIQVTGLLIYSYDVGNFDLSVSGSDGPLVEVPGTNAPLPGEAEAYLPLAIPHHTQLHLHPTPCPRTVVFPGCCAPSFSVYNAKYDYRFFGLQDDAVVCIRPPYNIEATFCETPRTVPVQLKLAYANCTTIKRQNELDAPYFLFGNEGANILPNTQPLPDGGYYLYTKVDGVTRRIRFSQCCGEFFICSEVSFPKTCSLTI